MRIGLALADPVRLIIGAHAPIIVGLRARRALPFEVVERVIIKGA